MHEIFVLTARQYGEVVLPDDSTGHGPDTLARKLSRCKPCLPAGREGMACVFAVQVQILLSITRIAVQVLSEPVNCHRTECLLRALAQCRGTICFGARNLSRCRIYIAGRCACPDASFGSICHGSRVPQKP
jgi:hypothetical protein